MTAMFRLLLAGLACCLALPALAAFTDNGDGTVTDTVTGLMWDKCSWGQSNTTDCSGGAASSHTWADALALTVASPHRGYTDWRLPSKNELESLLDIAASNPAIDAAAFPNTVANGYWTSTTYALGSAWFADFDGSDTLADLKTSVRYVRLVRGGRSFESFDSMGDFTPAAFSFTAQTGIAVNTAVESNAIPLSGLTTVTGISISGGQYKINGGSYTSAPGAVGNGDQITLKLTSSASVSTLTTATLTVGGVGGAFNVTTAAAPVVHGVCGAVAATSFKPAGACASGTVNAAGVVRSASSWTWACDGSGGGTSTPANACAAAFGPTATNSGGAASEVSGGTWSFAPGGLAANQTSGFIATSGHGKSPPDLPPGYSFPHGLLDFVLQGGVPGSPATIMIVYPSALPAGTVYWKYGPEPGNAVPHWYQFPAVIAGNTVTLTITDGGQGDDDLNNTNGIIVDQGGPGVPGVLNIPTLSEWGMAVLSALMALFGLAWMRRREGVPAM